jgi:integrase
VWTDREIKGLKPQKKEYRITENSRERNRGRLAIKVLPDGHKYFYFQYFIRNKRKTISIGRYKSISNIAGVTLAEARDKAREWGALVSKSIDVKQHLEEIARENAKDKLGSFQHLLDSYVAGMEANGKRSYKHVERSLKMYVTTPFQSIMILPANEITTRVIRDIIGRMIDKGVTTHSNRVRSYLHAAFQHGIMQDNNPRKYTKQRLVFDLKFNPVSLIPRQKDFEFVGQHVISADEIKIIWEELPKKHNIINYVIELAFETGQRTGELLRIKWSDCNFDKKQMLLPAEVSKNGREHLVPLNNIAIRTLENLKLITGSSEYLFPAYRGGYVDNEHMFGTTLSKVVRDFCIGQKDVSKFTPRDIRRTVKTIMGEAGISKEIRDRIQNHALNDVSTKHYDRYDYLKEKREGITIWGDYLDKIINPNKNVIRISKQING